MRRLIAVALLVVVVVAFPAVASAQPLADRVPDDAIVYVGWSGRAQMGQTFEQSHLKAVLDSSNIPQLFTEFVPNVIAKINEKEGEGPPPEAVKLATSIGRRIYHRPTALVFGGVDMSDPRNPMPRVALLVDAGNEADAMLAEVNTALAGQAGAGAPTAKKVGNVVVVSTLDYGSAVKQPLAASPKFTAAVGQVQKDAVFSTYVDFESALKLVDDAIAADNDPQAKANWPKIRDALNLRGLKRVASSAGFEGKDWGYRVFVEAPAPRTGIVGFLEGKPVSDDALKLIPATATIATAGHFDIAALIDQIRGGAQKADPQIAGKIGMVFGMADGLLGMNLHRDLFTPMGSEWVSYVAPNVGGSGLLGVVLVNRLDDAAKVEASLKQFEAGFNNAVRNQLAGKDITVEVRTEKLADGTALQYFATPLITPSWAVKNGNLVVGLYPQVVAAAVQHTPGKDKSILDNEKFVALRKRLEAPGVTSIQYSDLQASVPTGYATWLLVSRYIGMADIFGIKSPTMLIPPMHVLQQHLAPAGAVTWTDAAGWHLRGTSPFPGSETLASDPLGSMMVAQPAIGMSILLPSLNRARETANRVKCASNERQIGQAMLLYANDNKGKYPPRFGDLLRTQDITIDVFTCPSTDLAVPADVRAGGVEAMAKWIDEGNSSYVYLGAGKNFTSPADMVLVYEKLHNHDGDGINSMFGDGHVEFHLMESARQMLQQQNVPLGE